MTFSQKKSGVGKKKKLDKNFLKLIEKEMITCCEKPKLIFTHNITNNRLEILCENCGVAFWNWVTDCEHKVEIKQ